MRAMPLLPLAIAAVACSTGSELAPTTGPAWVDSTPPSLYLAAVAGDGQSGIVGTRLPASLEVVVRDTAGDGVAGVLVQFAVVGTNARLTPSSGTVHTGSDGRARVAVTLGRRAEPVHAVAASAGAAGSAAFDLVAMPSPALTLVPVSGDSQIVALPGAALEPFVVAVRDTFGNRVTARPTVVFRVAGAGATFGGQDSVAVVADTAGRASAAPTSPAPAEGDTVRFTAWFAGMAKPPLPAVAVGTAFRGKAWGTGAAGACALGTDGMAYCWGSGAGGALGNGDSTNRSVPTAVTIASGFLAVDAGGQGGCGLTTGGIATCWGGSVAGGPGGGSVAFRSIGAGANTACGVSGSGVVQCWGSPFYYPTSAGVVPSPVRFTNVSAGYYHTCALTAQGRAYCWGSNSYGELGSGDDEHGSASPLPVVGGLTFRSLSAGGWHTCGLTTNGAAYCWGANYYGQIGDGSRVDWMTPGVSWRTPRPVAGGLTFSDISAGVGHTCAVTPAGAAYCWGKNGGELGIGTAASATYVTTPAPVAGGITFASISAGDGFTCGIAIGGPMYCWGGNSHGQLGIGSFGGPAVTTPTPVTGGLLFRP